MDISSPVRLVPNVGMQKRLVIFTKEQGGEAHCQVNNHELPNRVVFDWLDAVLPQGR